MMMSLISENKIRLRFVAPSVCIGMGHYKSKAFFTCCLVFLLALGCKSESSGGDGTPTVTKHTLTIAKPGNGTVVGDKGDINCGNGGDICKVNFDEGSQVTLTATAAIGYAPGTWGDACANVTDAGAKCTVTMDTDKTVSKVFLRDLSVAPVLSYSSSENQLNWAADSRFTYTLESRELCMASSSWSMVAGTITSPHTLSSEDNGYFRLKACLDADCSPWSDEVGTLGTKGVNKFYGGDGSRGDPFLVGDYDGLKAINNNLAGYYRLIADIDASPSTSENGGKGFLPIGSTGGFTGSLDGCDNKVTGLRINRPTADYGGLFGYTNGGNIRDLGLEGADIDGGQFAGGLVGLMAGASIISRVYATGGDIAGNSATAYTSTGGLVGIMTHTSRISQSYASLSVSSNSTNAGAYSGGLVGSMNNTSSVHDSYATGDVRATTAIEDEQAASGGLVGSMNDTSSIRNSYATGNVSSQSSGTGSTDADSGGLVGSIVDNSSITYSYATGTPTASGASTNSAKGLIGRKPNRPGPTINNNYSKTANDGLAGITVQAGDWIRDSLNEMTTLHWNQEDPDGDGTWTDLAEPIWGQLGRAGVFPCLLGVTANCS